ncbi:MAG: hypothetical protein SF162_17240 [bacterium]|nr:hypothetical protein [bacterium]
MTSFPSHAASAAFDANVNAVTFPVDAEHGGIRAVVLFAFIGSGAAGFLIASALIPSEGLNLIALVIALLVGAGGSTLLERQLRQTWPSGRTVTADQRGVRIEKRGAVEQHIPADAPAQAIFWRFEIQKRTRIPKGWWMLACALESEGRYLVVYTFVSPDTYAHLPLAVRFKKLMGKKEQGGQKDARDDVRLAGEQRRLREAENIRWLDGAEMVSSDFVRLIAHFDTHYSEWMPVQ